MKAARCKLLPSLGYIKEKMMLADFNIKLDKLRLKSRGHYQLNNVIDN